MRERKETIMCSPVKCGSASEASDGTVFYPAILYNVASRNIGIVQNQNGYLTIYSNHLYASPVVAEVAAREWRDAYEANITAGRRRQNA